MEIKTEAFHKFSTCELSFYFLYLSLMFSAKMHSHIFLVLHKIQYTIIIKRNFTSV